MLQHDVLALGAAELADVDRHRLRNVSLGPHPRHIGSDVAITAERAERAVSGTHRFLRREDDVHERDVGAGGIGREAENEDA